MDYSCCTTKDSFIQSTKTGDKSLYPNNEPEFQSLWAASIEATIRPYMASGSRLVLLYAQHGHSLCSVRILSSTIRSFVLGVVDSLGM
jgi:hypothetical protein